MSAQASKEKSADEVFAALCATTDFLDSIGCPYFLSGGTLLGALRDQDIIAHDKDFDIDCFAEDRDRILEASRLQDVHGIVIRVKEAGGYEYPSGKAVPAPSDASCLYVSWRGVKFGDIFPFTRFSDGFARRFHPQSGTLYNAKLSVPSYFYSGNETLCIRNRQFRTPRHPELLVTRNYGPEWRTPLRSGQFPPGTNQTSGEILDSDIETLVLHAVANDPLNNYSPFPAWPAPVCRTNSKSSVDWIRRHETALREDTLSATVLQQIRQIDRAAAEWKLTALVRTYAYFVYRDELDRLASLHKALKDANKHLQNSNKLMEKSRTRLESRLAKLQSKYSLLHSKASRVSRHLVFRLLCRFKSAAALRQFLAKHPPPAQPAG